MILLALIAAVAALSLLALATDRHRDRLRPHNRRWLRPAGWAMVVAALAAAIVGWGPVYGPIGGIGLLMLAAGANLLVLNLTRR